MNKSIQKQLSNNIVSAASRRAQIQKQIALHLGLDYSIVNKSVIVNFISNGIANIVVNNDWNNKVDFNLSQLAA